MGKKAKSPSAKKAEIAIDSETAQKVTDIKNEGNKLFAKKEYLKAIEQYDEAGKLLPDGAAEKADLLCNKAACYYQMKRFKDAAKECSNALAVAPTSSKALLRRAYSYEKQGFYKQALSDIQAVNRTELATDETRDAEKRLKDVVAGRRTTSLTNGAGSRAAGAAPNRPSRAPGPMYFNAKCQFGDESRLVHLHPGVNYAQLLDLVRGKFPEAGVNFMLKYVDKDGDLVTLTNKHDLQAALAEALAGLEKRGGLTQLTVPTIRLQVVKVEAGEVPVPPPEELAERDLVLMQQRQQLAKAAAEGRQQQAQAQGGGGPDQVVEVDEWLVEFANLFRDMSGVDPDRHIDFHNEGWEACTRAMEVTLRSDAALPLFEKSMERFKEVTCTGLLNWGNVHVCIAHKHLDQAAELGESVDSVKKVAEKEFDKAEGRYKEAFGYKPDFFDGLCAMGQLEFERAKLRAKLAIKPVSNAQPADGAAAAPDGKAAAENAAAAAAALAEALQKVTAKDVDSAAGLVKKAEEWFDKARQAAEAADAKKKKEEEAKKAKEAAAKEGDKGEKKLEEEKQQQAANGTAKEGEISLVGQAEIMHGNIMYEWSQLLAAVGKTWRPVLDDAVARFKGAGCSEADIRNALKNHTQVEHLDLGPDPETEAETEPEAAAAKEQQPKQAAAKGLPSLEVKKKPATTTA